MSTIKHVLNAHPVAVRPYLVRRNTRRSLPVYTDIRNAGTRHLVQIRNVDGCVDSLIQDLRRSLFDQGSPNAQRLSVKAKHQRHVILSGGRFKRDVLAWLTAKGF